MRLMMSVVAGFALACPAMGQSAGGGQGPAVDGVGVYQWRGGEGAGIGRVNPLGDSGKSWVTSWGGSGGAGAGSGAAYTWTAQQAQPGAAARPGPDASMETIRSFMQARGGPVEVDGEPVTLRATGASLQVYLGDEPYPESRMRTEKDRTILLAADGTPGAQMLVEGQRVVLLRADAADPQRGVAIRDAWGQPVTRPGEGRLLIGVSLTPLDPTLARHLKLDTEKASVISSVTEGWPAAGAGLSSGDVIVSVEDGDDGTAEALRRAISERDAGDTIRLGVVSGGERKDVTVTLSDKAREQGFALTQPGSPTANLFFQQQAGQRRYAATQERSQAEQSEWSRRAAVAVLQAQEDTVRARSERTGQSREQTRAPDAPRQAAGGQGLAPSQWVVPETLWTARSDNDAQVFVRIPSGGAGGRALVSSTGESELSRRLGMIEARIARMEEMLQKLTEQSGGR